MPSSLSSFPRLLFGSGFFRRFLHKRPAPGLPAPESRDPLEKGFRIAIIAGEPSGDRLGAGLLQAMIRQWEQHPDLGRTRIRIEGIGGPRMMAAGCHSLYPMERLSVAGLSEALARVPELLRLRTRLIRRLRADPPDVFIGIDAPDFNLYLEKKLRASGIPVVHYVSPTVWAARGYRIKKIARAVDLMLTLFPFEAAIYQKNRIPVRFVGHPLADEIPQVSDEQMSDERAPNKDQARRELALAPAGKVVALLPGSRRNEVQSMAEPMLRAARWIAERRPGVRFVAPFINAVTRGHFEEVRARVAPDMAITVLDKRSRTAMTAADAVLVAAGTATLEALLLERPMVIALHVAPLTYHLGRAIATVEFVGLPNLLAGRALVPEFIQQQATPERLGQALLAILDHPEAWTEVQAEFRRIGAALRRNADESAATAVLNHLDKLGGPDK
uniref:Lipid-A-disaccharide synthase n=1 Tax=Candidatus Kentrum sp. FM TaxID=2126340 RepID=A0A450SU69_9GAMM|nr:MAG: lipid-A-disaccharide synthase [Candidatus Kentron sp. FM]VFJ57811.1 MAG: lipid-A-disaccharide synthase [Candidatus Kentron sp. FM]VFK11605.1 MAG: lipid-A-disaccharide synthase [Candidatus Kentron sp. FM]